MIATSETVTVLKFSEREYSGFKGDDGRDIPAGTTRQLTIDVGDSMETYRVHRDAVDKARALKTGQQVRLQFRTFESGGLQIMDIGGA